MANEIATKEKSSKVFYQYVAVDFFHEKCEDKSKRKPVEIVEIVAGFKGLRVRSQPLQRLKRLQRIKRLKRPKRQNVQLHSPQSIPSSMHFEN